MATAKTTKKVYVHRPNGQEPAQVHVQQDVNRNGIVDMLLFIGAVSIMVGCTYVTVLDYIKADGVVAVVLAAGFTFMLALLIVSPLFRVGR